MEWWKEFIEGLFSLQVFSEIVASMIAGVVLSFLIRLLPFTRHWLVEKPPEPESYSQRLAKLTQELTQASSEVDSLLAELAQVARDRENTVQELGNHLAELEQKEAQLQKRIEELQGIPIPAADHFARLVQSGEKRSAWRDYILFGAGVVVSIIVSLIID
jgi:septal ring factor EnvC (AmiA/AmiB activator)